MRPSISQWVVLGVLIACTGCLTDFEPMPGTRTQTQDGAGAKLFGFEDGTIGMGTTPDPYTATQLLSYDNRDGLAPSPASPVLIENAANDGFGAFSGDGLIDRDGHGTLNHKGITNPEGTLHTFRRSVLCVDTAPGCQYFANVVRDNCGVAGTGVALCFEGPAEIIDTMNLALQDAQGNRIRSVDDLMGLLVKARMNGGDTSLDVGLRRMEFGGRGLTFRKPINIHVGNARLFNIKLAAEGNRESIMQLVSHLKRTGFKTNDPVKGLTLDFGDFKFTLPGNASLSFNMKKMDSLYTQFSRELKNARMKLR